MYDPPLFPFAELHRAQITNASSLRSFSLTTTCGWISSRSWS